MFIMNYIQRDMDFFMQNQLAQSFTRCSCSKMYVGFAIQLTFSAYPHVFFFFSSSCVCAVNLSDTVDIQRLSSCFPSSSCGCAVNLSRTRANQPVFCHLKVKLVCVNKHDRDMERMNKNSLPLVHFMHTNCTCVASIVMSLK